MKVGDLVMVSPARKEYSIGIVLKQASGTGKDGSVYVHWVRPNGLGVTGLSVWEDCDKLEVVNESR